MSDIALILAKARKKAKGMRSADSDEEDEEDEDMGEDASDDEVEAFREYQDAGSPEEKAAALKRFIKLCGGY